MYWGEICSMIQFFKSNIEPNKKLRSIEILILVLLCVGSIVSVCIGFSSVHSNVGKIQYQGSMNMVRDEEEEDYDSDSTICDVIYREGDKKLVVSYTYEEYENLDENTIVAYEYKTTNGTRLYFDHNDVCLLYTSQLYIMEIQVIYQLFLIELILKVRNFLNIKY